MTNIIMSKHTDGQENVQLTPEAIFTGLAVIVSVVSLIATWIQSKRQVALTRETEALTERLSQDESTEARRRFFVDLWDKMKGVSEINPRNPIGPDVEKDLNALELIAVCYEENIVDRHMVIFTFGKMYHLLYTQIGQISDPVPGMGANGPRLLSEAPVITRVHKAITEELNKVGISTQENKH